MHVQAHMNHPDTSCHTHFKELMQILEVLHSNAINQPSSPHQPLPQTALDILDEGFPADIPFNPNTDGMDIDQPGVGHPFLSKHT